MLLPVISTLKYNIVFSVVLRHIQEKGYVVGYDSWYQRDFSQSEGNVPNKILFTITYYARWIYEYTIRVRY